MFIFRTDSNVLTSGVARNLLQGVRKRSFVLIQGADFYVQVLITQKSGTKMYFPEGGVRTHSTHLVCVHHWF